MDDRQVGDRLIDALVVSAARMELERFLFLSRFRTGQKGDNLSARIFRSIVSAIFGRPTTFLI